MEKAERKGAVGALLSVYEKALATLQNTIKDISNNHLVFVLNAATENPECRSIQTILTHVVSSGFSYCIYIQNARGINTKRPEKVFHLSVTEYLNDLDEVMNFTTLTFSSIKDEELEEFDPTKKIATKWGQQYDIEQLMEHAIVHILRHNRQIENFKNSWNN